MRRYLIVGSGVAGVSAAQTLRRLDPAGEVTMVSYDPFGYYSRPGLAYYLTNEIGEKQLFPFQEKDWQALKIRRLRAWVSRLHPAEHRLELSDGASLVYDRLLLATGSQALPLGIPGADLEGVVKLDDLADARRILNLCKRARRAIVIGGAITALELVEGLRACRLQVTYLLRGSRYWSGVLDETEARLVERRLAEEGVHILPHTELAAFQGQRGRLTGAVTTTGQHIPCDLAAAAIGIAPRKELAAAAGLRTERGILVNDYLETSAPDIYAAGDVAQIVDPLTGEAALDTLWGPARRSGAAAAQNMAGEAARYLKQVPFNVTRLAGLPVTIIGRVGQGADQDVAGIVRGDSETWRQLPNAIIVEQSYEVNRLRLLVGERALVGAVVMGDQTLSRPIYELVRGGVDLSSCREALFSSPRPAEVIGEFWRSWRAQSET
ncbi:MAG: FAD-dependent oxidoreductase [Anaerolineae bacterium]|nr:FAD-dependent oxidoreductase [Anaerolineae bacterium]